MAREFSEEAILKLAELMRSKDVPPNTVIAAINSLLDRGVGKPVQPSDGTIINTADSYHVYLYGGTAPL